MKERHKVSKSIVLLFIESALTKALFVVPLAYLLWSRELGLSQFEIGLVQGIFALTMMVTQIPTGYFADRVSHRASNAMGDLFLAVGMVLYFFAGGFWSAVLAEVFIGIGFSLSGGADSALLKAHCEKAGLSYRKYAARLTSVTFVTAGLAAIIGGFMGANDLRWPYLVQAGVCLIAFVIALQVKASGWKRVSQEHPLRDLQRVTKYLYGHKRLFWRMLLGANLMSSTIMLVWFLTPIFLRLDLPIQVHGFLFAAIALSAIVGSEYAVKHRRLSIIAPFLFSAVAYLVLGTALSIATFLIFLLSSFARGFNSARVVPYIQEIAPNDLQASAISMYNMLYRVFSSVAIISVNYVGNKNIQSGLLFAGGVCIIMFLVFKANKVKWA